MQRRSPQKGCQCQQAKIQAKKLTQLEIGPKCRKRIIIEKKVFFHATIHPTPSLIKEAKKSPPHNAWPPHMVHVHFPLCFARYFFGVGVGSYLFQKLIFSSTHVPFIYNIFSFFI